MLADFKNEAALLATLDDENVMAFLACIKTPTSEILVTEWLAGGTLHNTLNNPKARREARPFPTVAWRAVFQLPFPSPRSSRSLALPRPASFFPASSVYHCPAAPLVPSPTV